MDGTHAHASQVTKAKCHRQHCKWTLQQTESTCTGTGTGTGIGVGIGIDLGIDLGIRLALALVLVLVLASALAEYALWVGEANTKEMIVVGCWGHRSYFTSIPN